MPGRRSISVEPENIAVASPRRSSRIKVNHQDSPLPAAKTITEQQLPVKRTRRSSSIQEKSLSDIKDDLKKTQDINDEKPKTPARRTRRSISAQEEQKPVLKEISIKLRRSEIKKIAENNEDDEQPQQQEDQKQPEEGEDQKTPPQNLENVGGRPKRRVTRSMSKSPVSLKNAKAPPPTAAPTTRSRRLSLNDKQASDLKVPTLDIITENESEHEKIEETRATDVLNNNKKQTETSEKETTTSTSEESKTENAVESAKKTDETETNDIPGDKAKETPEVNLKESPKETLNTSSPRRSPRVKANESTSKQEDNEIEIIEEKTEPETKLNEEKIKIIETKLNEEKIEMIEKKLNELIEVDEESKETPPENNVKDELKPEEIETKIEEIQENDKDKIDSDKLNKSNISIVGNTSISSNLNSSILKEKEEIAPKVLENEEKLQNISLVNDDGRSFSPIIPNTDISVRLNNSRKSLNSTGTPQKSDVSFRNTSQTMESLQISMKDDEDDEKIIDETINTKDISANLDASKNSIKSTPAKSLNVSRTSVKSLGSGKKSNMSTPIKTTDNKENDDMNTSKSSKKKRASINQLREQILDDYIATFTAEKKRKRESMDASEFDSSGESKRRRSGRMTKVSSCNFSDDDDEKSDGETKNEFINDTVSVGSEDTPSIDSNEIIDDGESIGSSNSEHDSDDTYENDSFVVDDDAEDEELLSGTEDFLGSLRMPKRKRVIKMDSDSEEEKDQLENMSMEPYGGMSPSNLSEKQISNVDSDMDSIKNRNEELSKQIEDGTLVPEVEQKRKIEDSDSDDDIMIVEEKSKDEDDLKSSLNGEMTKDKNESTKEEETVEEAEDIQKETIKEAEDIQKETIEEPEDIKKKSIEEAVDIQKETIKEAEFIQKETIEETEDIQKDSQDIQKETIEEAENIQKETIEETEDIQKETIEETEDIQKETIEETEDIQKETIEETEDIQKETIKEAEENVSAADVMKSSNITEEKSDISANETKELNLASDVQEDLDETVYHQLEEEKDQSKRTEHENNEEDEETKETKYKKLVEKYFNVTNKNRSRRQTIGEETSKTPTKPLRKRKTSLGIELCETTREETKNKYTQDHEKKETQIIEVKIGSRRSENETDKSYEFNTSGVYEVSPSKIDSPQNENTKADESLLMLQDFNDSLNDSLDLLTSARQNKTKIVNEEKEYSSPNIERSTKKQKQNKTPVKSSEESDNTNTGSGKKKRKQNQLDDTSINEVSITENIVEEIVGKKKRKQRKSKANEKTENTESDTPLEETKSSIEIDDVSENETSSEKKKRKMRTEEVNTQNEKHKKKKLTKKQSTSSESDKTFTTLNSSLPSSTDSEKENSMEINKNRKKNKSPQNMFNFNVQNGKLSPSKSEIDYEHYVPPRHRNAYKNLIKPSSSGFSGSSQFIIKDLVSKVSHGIKKQKYNIVKLNKNSIAGMTNCGNWKETLLAEDMVKTVNISKASTFKKHKK